MVVKPICKLLEAVLIVEMEAVESVRVLEVVEAVGIVEMEAVESVWVVELLVAVVIVEVGLVESVESVGVVELLEAVGIVEGGGGEVHPGDRFCCSARGHNREVKCGKGIGDGHCCKAGGGEGTLRLQASCPTFTGNCN